MPALQKGDKVLVTGANGYLALWAVQKHLEHGYAVRASVRSEEKASLLREYFQAFADRLEIVIVTDMTKPGAFNDAVKGVDGIQHMASPTEVDSDDPDAYVKPAVEGTMGLLQSALLHGSTVKRVIYTSSTGTLFTPGCPPTTWNENDWNDKAVETIRREGKHAPRHMMYLASKVLAERAAWEFWEKHKTGIDWDFLSITAPWLLGPSLIPIARPDWLNGSLRIFYENCIKQGPHTREVLAGANTWVDTRDLADAYVKALETEEAGGERLIIAKGIASWQDWINVMNSLGDTAPHRSQPLPKGYPDLQGNYINRYDVTKATKILNPTLRGMEETARDMLLQWTSIGY
ncbi:hypothetical protein GALMADRAFT_256369 [Galerina marginata CBS 339.88]|uniref:NAD-dependent epimerase/dehydratase domain-containing protein n=1 Tax=Galerina marginata (strain CBS 339.88) TaxID=685588 RepID=A0A067SDX8_GALM3|nr:hypothetical protein GALMADRAFT_256369 [Galerina marginata CBS 339.88]